jgi:hypothetical protein
MKAAQPKKYLVGGFSAILVVLAAVIALTMITHGRVNSDLQTYRETIPRVAALDRMKAAANALAASANKGAALAIARYISSGDAVGLIDREIESQRASAPWPNGSLPTHSPISSGSCEQLPEALIGMSRQPDQQQLSPADRGS